MRTVQQAEAAYQGIKPSRVAQALGCSSEHVLALIKRGELDAVDIGAGSRPEYRVSKQSFEAFLERRKVA
jgi:excisionase family DNA binding protein